jgi:hypothetical protein
VGCENLDIVEKMQDASSILTKFEQQRLLKKKGKKTQKNKRNEQPWTLANTLVFQKP